MTASTDILIDAFGRIRDGLRRTVRDLDEAQLSTRIEQGSNSIAWLLWHLSRVQDDHLADAMGTEQVWTAGGWARRFALPFPDDATGYGQSDEEVAAVRNVSGALLADYHDAVSGATIGYLEGLTDDDLDRIVDRNWNPPVTLAVRLVSVISDDLQHLGQAGFLRGIVSRR
ncbi:MAG TPA: DUF664 domain-containing protein [Lacisediminihabitans sp.]|uniref:mycothiol transferase n=1 Tax=Lacisediminihabitans sp. TaxID=2787631 RepID=UPI002EDB0B80